MRQNPVVLAAPDPSAMSHRLFRSWPAAYIGSVFVILVLYLVLPDGDRAATVFAAGILAVAAIAAGCARWQPRRVGAWILLGAGVLLIALAGAGVDMQASRPARGYPAVSDVLFLLAYLPLAVGLLWLGYPATARKRWPAVADTAILSLAVTLIVWIVLIRPTVITMHLTGGGKIIAVGSWIGDVAIFAAAALMLLTWRVNAAVAMLAAGVVSLMVADVVYATELRHGTWRMTVPVDFGILVFCALCGGAATVPAMARLTSHPIKTYEVSVPHVVALAVGLLVAPAALLVEATDGPVHTAPAIAVIAAVIALLILARVTVAIRTQRRRIRADRAVRDAATSISLANDVDQVGAALGAALADMLDGDGPGQVVMDGIQPDQSAPHARSMSEVSAAADEIRLPLPTPEGNQAEATVTFRGPRARLIELSDSLTTVAGQAATALRRIELADSVRSHERQQYFRTLVQQSTDVILICRDGIIAYATPSAMELFGRDVVGQHYDDLVVLDPEAREGDDGYEEGRVLRRSGTACVVIRRRDLTDDPTVSGVVITLRDVTAQRHLQGELEFRATHDPLTGLANGEVFREELRAAGRAGRSGVVTAVLFIDLDDFKRVNDSFGHAVGDSLLIASANRIRAGLRHVDLAARLGGDEFAVLLRDLPDPLDASAATERISASLSEPAHIGDIDVYCAASIGVATARTPTEHEAVLRRADIALYAAKAAGKNQWRAFDPAMIGRRINDGDLRAELAAAIEADALTLQYQPIVDLATGVPRGFEALCRWVHPVHGTVPPATFVRLVEQARLGPALDAWILDRAIADLPSLSDSSNRYVSVNVSAVQLSRRGFVDEICRRLQRAGIDASSVMLEIPETMPITEQSPAWQGLQALRDLGVRLALDDYGTGNASLSQLRESAVDVIKLDRSFVRNMSTARDRILVRAVIDLAKELDIDLIADGVQDQPTRTTLLDLGCRHGQGVLFAPALPLRDAVAWSGRATADQLAAELS